LEVLDAIRAGSSEDQPIVVLGEPSEQELAALCYEAGGDAYLCVHTTTTRALIWVVARAVERHTLIAENRRLQQTQQHRLRLEHDEAHRLLEQQRAMIADLSEIRCDELELTLSADACVTGPGRGRPRELPLQLLNHYRELLRAYVIMGAGNLSSEMERLAELLAFASVTPRQAMRLHLQVLEEMISGLGSRSARHVMSRADMLVLEVMINLAEQYRAQYLQRVCPPRQLPLPGFEAA
jgi:hypothetical protein